jgi:hypothetical protein
MSRAPGQVANTAAIQQAQEYKRELSSITKTGPKGAAGSLLNEEKLDDIRKAWPNFYKDGPNPTFLQKLSWSKLQPSRWYNCAARFIMWATHIFWALAPGGGYPKCPLCKRTMASKGWSNTVRRVLACGRTMYLCGYRYVCKDCPGKI